MIACVCRLRILILLLNRNVHRRSDCCQSRRYYSLQYRRVQNQRHCQSTLQDLAAKQRPIQSQRLKSVQVTANVRSEGVRSAPSLLEVL